MPVVWNQLFVDKLEPRLAERIRWYNAKEVPANDGRFILCWLHHALRAHENPALDAAILASQELSIPLMVYHGLSERYRYASARHHHFILEGAKDLQAECESRGIPAAFHLVRPGHREPALKRLANEAALIVTDDFPLEPIKGWLEKLASHVTAPIMLVDTACVVPSRLVGKAFTRAFEFRQATQSQFAERISHSWVDAVYSGPPSIDAKLPFEPIDYTHSNLASLVASCDIDHSVPKVTDTFGGSVAGYGRWESFKKTRLVRYAKDRNNPLIPANSRMSAYLHYGMVSPLRIAREAHSAGTEGGDKYLDELLIWRELAYAFCHYRRDVDTANALPDWAVKTLRRFTVDRRAWLATWERLAHGQSPDDLWNACQVSLLRQGELHNNVRMTWGKALIGWTAGVEDCLHQLIDLNHRYALDGRDPASYGGLLWCLGQFDRPFTPETPILGTVRPRPTSEHAARLDVAKYTRQVSKSPLADSGPIAIVGAGLAGLFCGRLLASQGADIQLFDKGRGVGGRMATRRPQSTTSADAVPSFDHGVIAFEFNHPNLAPYRKSWLSEGVIEGWQPKVALLDAHGNLETTLAPEVIVGSPTNNHLAKHLAEGQLVSSGEKVDKLVKAANGWTLFVAGSPWPIRFSQVLLAVPPANVVELLKAADNSFQDSISVSLPTLPDLQPCWTAMVSLSLARPLPWDILEIESTGNWAISTIVAEHHKPARMPCPPRLTVHCQREWSAIHIEDTPDDVAKRIGSELTQHLGDSLNSIDEIQIHRWRYAAPPQPTEEAMEGARNGVPIGHVQNRLVDPASRSWFDPVAKMGLGGDWLAGAGVEAALLSGMNLAGQVMAAAVNSDAT
jgi:photolyase PhrII